MQPNVLYLVLDCLRTDVIDAEVAPTLSSLAESNLYFESCVAPSNWSLPSHASIFTGEYPHRHHCYHQGHQLEELPLVNSLNDNGYTTIGVSANIYASSSHGFDNGFDAFYETRRPLNPRGLNPFSAVRERQRPSGPRAADYLHVLGDAVRHERPVASLGNYFRAVAIELDRRYQYRQQLPFVDHDDYGFLTRASERSERLLSETFDRHDSGSSPFFAFANLMDTHYPYEPPARFLAEETNGEYTKEDLQALEPDISNSWVFLEELYSGGIDEESVDLVRAAYRAEVRSVDERVHSILNELERRGMLEETLVIITSDHGECLGELDVRGERSMGHLDSISEQLRTVPLIVANPRLDSQRVQKPVPLHRLSDLLMDSPSAIFDIDAEDQEDIWGDSPVLFELPANPHHEESYERYDGIPDWFAEREAETHTVVGLADDWVVVVDSTGKRAAWVNCQERTVSDAPSNLVTECEQAVDALAESSTESATDMSSGLQQQLEDLGYL